MTHHIGTPLKNIPPNILSHLTGLVRSQFQIDRKVISIHPVLEGENQASHFVMITEEDTHFGIKHSQGVEVEKMATEIAQLLKAPNACPTIFLENGIPLHPFKNKPIIITNWLYKSEIVRDIPKELLTNDLIPFFYQFGEWIAFSLLFGVRDRHQGNWVWSIDEKKLSMIDMEESFGSAQYTDYLWAVIEFSNPERFKNPSDNQSEGLAFKNGVIAMVDKFKTERKHITAILSQKSVLQAFSNKWMELNEDDFLRELFVGL